MFVPYCADLTLYRLPVITISVTLLCIVVYAAQYSNQQAMVHEAAHICEAEPEPAFSHALNRLFGRADTGACMKLLLRAHLTRDTDAYLQAVAEHVGVTPGVRHADLNDYYQEVLQQKYRAFARHAPDDLTQKLWYPPESWNVRRMLTAAIAHGSWLHLVGNLFFFFAFAASLEILLGPVLFMLLLAMFAIGTHSVYSLATVFKVNPGPTIGLSGVVMGVIALFTYFLPRVRIRCFFWLVVFYRRIGVPAWVLALWYIGWDVYAQVSGAGPSQVNLVAHLAGAALGLSLGITLFRAKRHWAQELVGS